MSSLVSLDVFDTAIFRKVISPEDIFSLIEENKGFNFKQKRMEAQSKARLKNIFYSLSDIYEYLPSFDIKDEIRAEYTNCEPNLDILNLYKSSSDSDFIFISDMYLPSVLIKSMLEKCGYHNPCVFVSCELKVLKGNGSLFKKVEEILKRKIDKHIGDNYSIDIEGARRAGIKEVEYIGPAIYNRKISIPDLKSQKLRKFLLDVNLNSDLSIEEKIGYKFAPLALSFTKKVLDEVGEKDTVFFNARDSFLMYVIARWILKSDKNVRYCRFSRKSCHFPNINTNFKLDSSVNSKALGFFRTLKVQTLRDFINMFNLEGDFVKELNTLNTTLDSPLDFSNDRNKLLLNFIELSRDKIYEKAREDRKNLLQYIKKLGMKDGDFFVDLGHFGSMQSIIKKLANISLKGRYIHRASLKDYFQGISEDKKSFLPIGFIRAGMIEVIFSEPRGTVISYDADGHPVLNKDMKFRKEITKRILRSVFRGVKKLLKDDILIPYEDCVKIVKEVLEFPSVEEAEFGNSKIFENGSYNDNESIVWFNEEYIKRGRIKDCYNRSYWKDAFRVLLRNSKYCDLERYLKL